MRLILFPFVLILAACASTPYVRARGGATGELYAQAFMVTDQDVETALTPRYYVKGTATIVVQPVIPFLTINLDKDSNILSMGAEQEAAIVDGRVRIIRNGVTLTPAEAQAAPVPPPAAASPCAPEALPGYMIVPVPPPPAWDPARDVKVPATAFLPADPCAGGACKIP